MTQWANTNKRHAQARGSQSTPILAIIRAWASERVPSTDYERRAESIRHPRQAQGRHQRIEIGLLAVRQSLRPAGCG